MAAPEEVPDFLNIAIAGATGLKNTALLGKQDVYVSATYGPYTLKTSVVKNGGSAPVWPGGPDTFTFVVDNSKEVRLQVLVPHRTKDDVEIGSATLQENAWSALQRGAPAREMLLPLYKDNRPAGALKTFVSITWGPPGYSAQRPPQPAAVMGVPAYGQQQPAVSPYDGMPQQQPYHQQGPYGQEAQHNHQGAAYPAPGSMPGSYQQTPAPYQETPAPTRYQETPAPYKENAAPPNKQSSAVNSTPGQPVPHQQQGQHSTQPGPYTQNPFAPQQQGQPYSSVPQYPPTNAPPPSYPPQQQPGYSYPPQQQPYGQAGPYGAPPYPPPGGMPVVYDHQRPGYGYQQQRPYGGGRMGGGMGAGGMMLAGGAGLAGGMLLGSALTHDSYDCGDGGGGDFGGGDGGGGE